MRRDQRVAVLGIADRRAEDLGERHRAVVAQAAASRRRRRRAPPRRAARCRGSGRGRARGNARSSRLRAPRPGRRSSSQRRFSSLHTRIGASPSGPFRCGSTTCRVKPAAAAASKALPPFSRTLIATAEASQWVEATTPKVPRISGRVVKAGHRVSPEVIAMFVRHVSPVERRLAHRKAPSPLFNLA